MKKEKLGANLEEEYRKYGLKPPQNTVEKGVLRSRAEEEGRVAHNTVDGSSTESLLDPHK